MDSALSGREWYERGRMLRQNKMYGQALADFRRAIEDPQYRGQAYTQTALCLRALGQHEKAVEALRHAVNSSSLTSNESMHVLYLLGQSLEALGRRADAIEAYNWVRQEDAHFLDVDSRIKQLCGASQSFWTQPLDLLQIGRFLVGKLALR